MQRSVNDIMVSMGLNYSFERIGKPIDISQFLANMLLFEDTMQSERSPSVTRKSMDSLYTADESFTKKTVFSSLSKQKQHVQDKVENLLQSCDNELQNKAESNLGPTVYDWNLQKNEIDIAAIEKVIEDIKFQTKPKETIRLDDVHMTRKKHDETDSWQF